MCFRILVLSIFVLFSQFSFSQGCSDAGACSLGAMRDNQEQEAKRTFSLNNQLGIGEQSVSILTTQFEYYERLNEKHGLQLRLPFTFVSGNLGSVSGIGDITLAYLRKLALKKTENLSLNLGLKLATGATNLNAGNSPTTLPMPYQTGLGTYDFILGVNYFHQQKWLFAAGIQVPVYQLNNNNFDTSFYSSNSDAYQYFSSSGLMRQPDVVFRAEKIFKFKEKYALQAGFIPIYHLGNDRQSLQAKESEIENSGGLTLNLSIALKAKLHRNWELNARFASPMMVREVRPDGLTRQMVMGLELKYLILE